MELPSGSIEGNTIELTIRTDVYKRQAVPSEAIVPEMGKDKIFLYKSGKAQPVEITRCV